MPGNRDIVRDSVGRESKARYPSFFPGFFPEEISQCPGLPPGTDGLLLPLPFR